MLTRKISLYKCFILLALAPIHDQVVRVHAAKPGSEAPTAACAIGRRIRLVGGREPTVSAEPGRRAASSHKFASEAAYFPRAVHRDVALRDAMEHRRGYRTGREFVVNRIRVTLGASHLLVHQRLNPS